MAVSVNETEIKYDAPAATALPRLDDLPRVARASEPTEELLEAEYYDTSDLRLVRAGVTLRRRQGGTDPGWHLKLPVETDTRQEIRLPLGREPEVPEELTARVRVHTRGQPLRPVARISTRRQRLTLMDGSGKSLAEVAIDDVSAQTMGDSTAISRWQEVELELTGGDRKLLAAADRPLRRAGLRPAGHAAKLERALGLEPARPAGQPRLKPSSPAGEVVRAYLRAQADRLKSVDLQVRTDEPDSAHQMRVAVRRLRSTLRTFADVIGPARASRLASELKWLGGVLGEVREPEMLSSHLQDNLHKTPVEQVIGPVQARVQRHFAPVRAAAREKALDALDSARYFTLLDDLDRLVTEPDRTGKAQQPAKDVLPAAVRRPYKQARRRMRKAWAASAHQSRDTGLHRARKSARRARYAGEVAAPALGKEAGRFANQMKKVQSLLGEHQDAVVARQLDRELGIAAHLAGENAFTYGLLYERDTGRRGQLQPEARHLWKRASRSRYRRWMR
jgi:CHAD domain-containing protein